MQGRHGFQEKRSGLKLRDVKSDFKSHVPRNSKVVKVIERLDSSPGDSIDKDAIDSRGSVVGPHSFKGSILSVGFSGFLFGVAEVKDGSDVDPFPRVDSFGHNGALLWVTIEVHAYGDGGVVITSGNGKHDRGESIPFLSGYGVTITPSNSVEVMDVHVFVPRSDRDSGAGPSFRLPKFINFNQGFDGVDVFVEVREGGGYDGESREDSDSTFFGVPHGVFGFFLSGVGLTCLRSWGAPKQVKCFGDFSL